MPSQVLYRKWRPQTLSDVVGQEHVTQTLTNALAQGRVAHAYLFCGPRGTGKTSTGRILAKAINCQKNGQGEPCNDCPMCAAITGGSALDLIEIDAASNRGIDEIRDLREKVNFSPSDARRKVYIIDEVHMLTDAAFNALLKTLEEPPSHVIFILATTEAHKLPATIVSRCQRFDFRRISRASVEERLRVICEDEKVDADPWVLTHVARSSDGSLRDAENLLEQLVVSYGEKLEPAQVRHLLGISADMPLQEFTSSLLTGRVSEGLRILNRARDQGVDLRQFQRELLERLRGLMMVKAGAEDLLDLPSEELADVKTLAPDLDLREITAAVHLFGKLDLRSDAQSSLPLETALVEYSLTLKKAPDQAPADAGPAAVPAKDPVPEPVPVTPPAPEATTVPKPVPVDPPVPPPIAVPRVVEAAPADEVSGPEAGEAPGPEAGETDQKAAPPKPVPVSSIDIFRSRWPELVDALRGVGSKGSLDALLRNACEPISVEGETLVVGFYYPFHKNKIEDPKYRHLVEKKVREVFGAPYRIQCDLVNRDERQPPERPRARGPLVEAALEMGAEIVDAGSQRAD